MRPTPSVAMIARAVLVAIGLATIGTGVAFCGLAIYLLLSPVVAAPAAAAITALVLFVAVGTAVTIHFAFAHRGATALTPRTAGPQSQDALVTALTLLAKEHPLMAVGCAAALGLTTALNRRAG